MWAFPPEDGANLMLVCEIRKKNIKKFMLTHQDSNLGPGGYEPPALTN